MRRSMKSLSTKLWLPLALLSALATAGCPREDPVKMYGTWKLTSFTQNGRPVPIPPTGVITLKVEAQRLSGFSGVNSFSGEYSVAKGKLRLGPLTSTLMLGLDEDLMRLEDEFLSALKEVTKVEATETALTLSSADGGWSLTFTKFALSGTEWKLTGYNSGGGITSDAISSEAALRFDSEAEFSGTSGFNRMRGSYRAEGDSKVAFDPPGMTRMLPPTPEAQDFERLFLELLQRSASFTVNGPTLTLLDGENTTLLVFTSVNR